MVVPEQTEMFGGPWTEQKLDAVTKYLRAFTTALKKQRFELLYIDAFAGSGYRARPEAGHKVRGFFPLEEKKLVEGSARRALAITPPFDRFIFIERNKGRFEALKMLADQFQNHRDRMEFINRDANEAVIEVCNSTNWKTSRAVLFLDPYGMQVEWSTLEVVARTEAIDVWLLFPLGVVNRLTPRKGPNRELSKILDRTFGDHGWHDMIYKEVQMSGFFDSEPNLYKTSTNANIEAYMRGRLNSIFKGGVAEYFLPLYNRRQSCMFLLMFACGNSNPKAHKLAHKIANHILKP